ncbi:unnamed protein product [Phaeothamnion confervicola]
MAHQDVSTWAKFQRKAKDDPFVPIGAFATIAFLGSGLYAFQKGHQRLSQKLMRGRVLAQGATVAVLMLGATMGARRERATPEDKFHELNAAENKWADGTIAGVPPARET